MGWYNVGFVLNPLWLTFVPPAQSPRATDIYIGSQRDTPLPSGALRLTQGPLLAVKSLQLTASQSRSICTLNWFQCPVGLVEGWYTVGLRLVQGKSEAGIR